MTLLQHILLQKSAGENNTQATVYVVCHSSSINHFADHVFECFPVHPSLIDEQPYLVNGSFEVSKYKLIVYVPSDRTILLSLQNHGIQDGTSKGDLHVVLLPQTILELGSRQHLVVLMQGLLESPMLRYN